jgi:hypothetical protein
MLRRFFNRYFKNRLFQAYRKQHRAISIITLANAKSVGILWNPIDEESIETYESLRKILTAKGIKSFGIAYIGSKREKDTLSTITNSWLMNSGNVTCFGRPKSGDGLQFIQQEFDILIDLSLQKSIALQYMLIHSTARFKVGWKGEDPNLYDLEIDISANPGCRFLMEQIIYYLEKLNENN